MLVISSSQGGFYTKDQFVSVLIPAHHCLFQAAIVVDLFDEFILEFIWLSICI